MNDTPQGRSFYLPLITGIIMGFLLVSCATKEDRYGQVRLFHSKPIIPRMIPRQMLGDLPSGMFRSHKIKGILVMDSGADYQGESSLTYMTNLLRRYRTKDGMGDLPFHYFIDAQGKIFMGLQDHIPADLHEGDPYLSRASQVEQKDVLMMRLARRNKPLLNIDGYITVVLLGDYDHNMVSKEQETSMFQLVSFLGFSYYIPYKQIKTLNDLFPEIQNPGFYLKNYLSPSILEKNIPPSPRKPHMLQVPGEDG